MIATNLLINLADLMLGSVLDRHDVQGVLGELGSVVEWRIGELLDMRRSPMYFDDADGDDVKEKRLS